MKQKTAEKNSRVVITWQIKFLFYFLIGIFPITSCSPNVKSEVKKEMQQSIIKESELSDEQRMEWISLLKEWQINEFNEQLKSGGFKQDCIDCSNITWKVLLQIDLSGKCTKVDLVERDVQCPKKSEEQIKNLQQKVFESFKEKKFPDSFKNLNLEARVGRVSKC